MCAKLLAGQRFNIQNSWRGIKRTVFLTRTAVGRTACRILLGVDTGLSEGSTLYTVTLIFDFVSCMNPVGTVESDFETSMYVHSVLSHVHDPTFLSTRRKPDEQ
jgi:hypothetical protein